MIVVVTGAAGSIGSSVVRVLSAGTECSSVRAVDTNETGLHSLVGSCPNVRPICADVRDEWAMRLACRGADAVVHCAALKHVTICEYNPDSAISVNVGGTSTVVRAADESDVKRFVLLSTDKASQPTSVMAATKLLAERLLPAYARWRGIETCAIRFGNVFYSRGSVLPVWVRAVGRGEPIRITDRSATRFSIDIDHAVMGIVRLLTRPIESGTTYVLPMKSYDLGSLADMFCAGVGHDVVQEVVGLQPGEKLHELALSPDESERAKPDGEFWSTNPSWPVGVSQSGVVWDSDHADRLQADDLRRLIERYEKK